MAWHIQGHKAELLLHIIHKESLIHYIQRSERDELLEVVGERLAAQIQPLHSIIDREILQHRRGVGEGEAAVDNEAALGAGHHRPRPPAAGLVEVDEGWGVGDVEGAEAEVLEDDLVGGALGGGEVEEGLDEEEVGVVGVDAEGGAEEAVPDLPLEVGVDEVAAVAGAAEGDGGEVVGGEELVGDQPTLGVEGPAGAVGNHRLRVPLAGDSCLAEPGAAVKHHHDVGDGVGGHWFWATGVRVLGLRLLYLLSFPALSEFLLIRFFILSFGFFYFNRQITGFKRQFGDMFWKGLESFYYEDLTRKDI